MTGDARAATDAVAIDDRLVPAEAVVVALADPSRRLLVDCLAGRERPVALRTLADGLATRVRERQPGGDGAAPSEAVRTRLHHVHLPKLEQVDLVDYDQEDGLVTPTPALTPVAESLDLR